MLSRINRIKRLDYVFNDFSWNEDVPAFKKVNLVYGLNGCGKTTLTRLFSMLPEEDSGVTEYEIEDSSGAKLTHKQISPTPIKVFNRDYVRRHIGVDTSSADVISVLLGEENIDLAAKIDADSTALKGNTTQPGLHKDISETEMEVERTTKIIDKTFTEIARTIGTAIIGSQSASRNYRAPNAKKDYDMLTDDAVLPEEEVEANIKRIKQDVMEPIPRCIAPMVIDEDGNRNALDLIRAINDIATGLCGRTVESMAIARLVDNPDIAEWVGHGVTIHKTHGDAVCEYCRNPISAERLRELAGHFNEADRQLKVSLQAQIVELRSVFLALRRWHPPIVAQLYPELRSKFKTLGSEAAAARDQLIAEVEFLGKTLGQKQLVTTQSLSIATLPNVAPLIDAIAAMNQVVDTHNTQTSDFSSRQETALCAIKRHYLSTIREDVEVARKSLRETEDTLKYLEAQKDTIEQRLTENRAKISSTQKACETINRGLASFLGRNEIMFYLAENGEKTNAAGDHGYRILRHGKPAVSLSEGEQTAVALIYFLVHLNDGQADLAETIVVIDDPISSLDSNSLYQAFAFLKITMNQCYQMFVLTHNFDFLRLLINWRSRDRRKTGYYMIHTTLESSVRSAKIRELDKTLRTFETEYLYLFKVLRGIQAENDGTIAAAYPVPNMARKLWESFVMYRVPLGANTYTRIELLKNEGFDKQKLDMIYKFTNDQSHITGAGLDPALVPEAEKALSAIFEIMEQAAPKHFEYLTQAIA